MLSNFIKPPCSGVLSFMPGNATSVVWALESQLAQLCVGFARLALMILVAVVPVHLKAL